jgi:dihydrofolate synthase/folylpolyglutamate synthase
MIKSVLWPKNIGKQDGPYKLDRINAALKKLGNPEKKIPFSIHIVGTNGKGSTTAFLKSILKEAGFISHVYTSPNLVSLNERVCLAGKEISDESLINLLKETETKLEELSSEVSFFEGFTAATLLGFSKTPADFSLIEAGLGGRFDATNVIDAKICVLTSVSFDHTEFLGETLKEITLEKIAVSKEKSDLIVAFQPYMEVYGYIDKGFIYGKDYSVKIIEDGFIYEGNAWKLKLPLPSLIGDHQIYNAATAIKACEILRSKYNYNINENHIKNGLLNAIWPARLQKINSGKAANFENLNIFLDGAHNENGIRVLLSHAKKTMKNYEKTYIIFGCLKRKDLTKIILVFKEFWYNFDGIYFTEIHSSEESQTSKNLVEIFSGFNLKAQGERGHFELILKMLNIKGKSRVIICGSLYLAGEFIEWNNI